MEDKIMKNFRDYEMTDASGIGIYCGTYKKYNGGSLFGMWIDLEKVDDAEEFFEVCRSLHGDESDPELMFQDYQGFPEELYHECMTEDDIEKILAYVNLDDDEKEMLENFCECYGDYKDATDIEDIKERCMGCYDSLRDFTDEMADMELDALDAPQFCRDHFDYESYAREMSFELSQGSHGYIFSDR